MKEFINDVNYKVEIREKLSNGKQKVIWKCPIYAKWDKMKTRCRNSSTEINPTYINKTICDDWYKLSNFSFWIKSLPIDEKYISKLELDKDIKISGNLIYSPDTCLLVPKYINNSVLIKHGRTKKTEPLGVTHDIYTPRLIRDIYRANMHSIFTEHTHLGSFYTAHEAHRAWQLAKIQNFKNIILKYRTEPFYYKDVEDALQRIIDRIQYEYEYDNDMETTYIV